MFNQLPLLRILAVTVRQQTTSQTALTLKIQGMHTIRIRGNAYNADYRECIQCGLHISTLVMLENKLQGDTDHP